MEEGALVAGRGGWRVLGALSPPLPGAPAGLARSQSAHGHVRIIGDLDPEAAADIKTLHQDLIDAHAERRREKLRGERWKRIVGPVFDALRPRIPDRDHRIVFQRRPGEAMEV